MGRRKRLGLLGAQMVVIGLRVRSRVVPADACESSRGRAQAVWLRVSSQVEDD
jgi:hypothetical protein